jgi:hypothetical protein
MPVADGVGVAGAMKRLDSVDVGAVELKKGDGNAGKGEDAGRAPTSATVAEV